MKVNRRRSWFRSLVGLCAVLGLATSAPLVAVAATWSEPVTIWQSDETTYDVYTRRPTSLVAVDDQTLIAAYEQEILATKGVSTFVTRSIDGGLTWSSGSRVSRKGTSHVQSYGTVLASYGPVVDVAWDDFNGSGQIRYRRSSDGGATFQPTIFISHRGDISYPDLAHGPNGVVIIGWYNFGKHKVFARVSHDDGATFGAKQVLFRGFPACCREVFFSVAVGDGVLYAAAGSEGSPVMVRRSADGASWTSAAAVSGSNTGARAKIVADGQMAYLAFIRHASSGDVPVVRRTTDGGSSWSGAVVVGPTARQLDWPYISLDAGVARIVFARCVTTTNPCTTDAFYRYSVDGTHWSTAESLSPQPAHYIYPFGIVKAAHIVVGYWYFAPVNYSGDIEVRLGDD